MDAFSEQFIELVREAADGIKGRQQLAQKIGCSRGHIQDFIAGRTMLGTEFFLNLLTELKNRSIDLDVELTPSKPSADPSLNCIPATTVAKKVKPWQVAEDVFSDDDLPLPDKYDINKLVSLPFLTYL